MKKQEEGQPAVVRSSMLWMQVCVPKDWDDAKITKWANAETPTGISSQWGLTTQAHADEHGYERCAQCTQFESHHHMLMVC